MDRLEALVGLNTVVDIGSMRLKKILELFDSPEKIFNASEDRLAWVGGIGKKAAARIKALKPGDIEKEFVIARQSGLRILAFTDLEYPENLKNIPDPPVILYVKGTLLPQDKASISIVGSRRASCYGMTSAEQLSAELSLKGLTIVSGLARGIDTYAHNGALKVSGRTIAVLGSGFNCVYPPENMELAEEITRSGAVVSEFPVDCAPLKQNFPRRNRVISGLSLGVVVVEAARNSGALITADFALEQGRDVFAMPGEARSSTSFGTNELIKQGAKLVTCAEDIMGELGGLSTAAQEDDPICALMQDGPLSLDEIVEKTNMEIPRISDILVKLEMRGLIKKLPGKLYGTVPADRERKRS